MDALISCVLFKISRKLKSNLIYYMIVLNDLTTSKQQWTHTLGRDIVKWFSNYNAVSQVLETGTPISEYKDSLTLLRSKQQSHYLRGWMKYQSHFLLASVIKENLVAWLFMHFSSLLLKKGNLNGMKGRKILKIKIKGKFPTNYIVFCFQKRKPKPVLQFPSLPHAKQFKNNNKRCQAYCPSLRVRKITTILLLLLWVLEKNIHLSSGMSNVFSHSNNTVDKIWIPSRTLKSQVKPWCWCKNTTTSKRLGKILWISEISELHLLSPSPLIATILKAI